MKRILSISVLLTASLSLALAQQPKAPPRPGLTLTTTAFSDGSEIPAKYTQSDPHPVSPQLDWTNVPPGTVTFTLILHDPDVAIQRKTGDVLHWMIFNIPAAPTPYPKALPRPPPIRIEA